MDVMAEKVNVVLCIRILKVLSFLPKGILTMLFKQLFMVNTRHLLTT